MAEASDSTDFKIVARMTQLPGIGHVLGYSKHYYEAAKSLPLPGVNAGLGRLEQGLASVAQSKRLHSLDDQLAAQLDLAGKKLVESKQKVEAFAEAGKARLHDPVEAIATTVNGLKNTTIALAEAGRVKYIAEPAEGVARKASELKHSTIALAEAGKNKFIMEPAAKVLDTTVALAGAGKQKLEGPVNSYLQHSVLSGPLNKALDIGEQLCDRYLGTGEVNGTMSSSDSDELATDEPVSDVPNGWHEHADNDSVEEGPVIRSFKLGKKLRRQAFSKLKSLNLRDTTAQPLRHCVDLIQYAANNFGPAAHGVMEITVAAPASALAVGISTAQNAGQILVSRAKPAVEKARLVVSDMAMHTSTGVAAVISSAAGVPATLYIRYSDHPLLRSAYAQAIIQRARSLQNGVIQLSPLSLEDLRMLSHDALERLRRLQEAEKQAIAAYPTLAHGQEHLIEIAEPIVQALMLVYRRLSVDSPSEPEPNLAIQDGE